MAPEKTLNPTWIYIKSSLDGLYNSVSFVRCCQATIRSHRIAIPRFTIMVWLHTYLLSSTILIDRLGKGCRCALGPVSGLQKKCFSNALGYTLVVLEVL